MERPSRNNETIGEFMDSRGDECVTDEVIQSYKDEYPEIEPR